jgi:hypothetical protein
VPKKQPFLVKEDAMKAAAGVFFRIYSGPADACKKLSLGDPKKATPDIIYYLTKIKESAELQSALAMPLKEQLKDSGEAVRLPDHTGATATASVSPRLLLRLAVAGLLPSPTSPSSCGLPLTRPSLPPTSCAVGRRRA